MKNIFITGGAGYVGSHCAISLANNNFNPIILDDFRNSYKNTIKKLKKITGKKIIFYDVNIKNKKKLKSIFKKHKCYAVIHCAGLKAVEESIQKPFEYFDNNIGSTLSLIETMNDNNVFNLVFSSSATVYNTDQPLPWKENFKTGITTNPYASSKFIIEKILMDLVKFDTRWSVRIARYFNPISNHFSGLLKEDPRVAANNLMPAIMQVAENKIPKLNVFGKNYKTLDGTAVRDYIHVMDLAEGHVSMLKNGRLKKGLKIFNFGTGKGTSVLEVIQEFEKQTGIRIPYSFKKKRKGDNPIFYCSPRKSRKELNWKCRFNLRQAMVDIKKVLNKT